MHTFHIHIEGQVQGVGFRPFVYKLAHEMKLDGWVNNTVDGVHVEINASHEDALAFYQALVERAPRLARITAHHMKEIAPKTFTEFQIVHSDGIGAPRLLLTPDFALCDACREELLDPADRRFRYPFITCTLCGPRFSITEALPYDRERTSMRVFSQCALCSEEYENPLDRRYYSQTNSCAECGVTLSLYDARGNLLSREGEEVIKMTAKAIKEGKIVAVKGIGGYLLCCDATALSTVNRLRERKGRPGKPFALMYPDEDMLRGDVFLNGEEAAELSSVRAPIVLLQLLENPASGIAAEAIAPGLDKIGAMLPYAPLYELLLQALGQPVVATSANVSNAPIIFDDERAIESLPRMADLILSHDRRIVIPQDDSVVRFSEETKEKIILRRSRGMAPAFILPDLYLPKDNVLAMGADLKSTFAILQQQNVYLSQYLGDLDNFDTQAHFKYTLDHFLHLLRTQPTGIIVDKHPSYFSTHWGETLARDWEVPVYRVQHHLAHFAAVMGEHHLFSDPGPILGIVWDGTGFGDDGHIWGGEFFLYQEGDFRREGHLDYFDYILGDKMAREPRIAALAIAHETEAAISWLRPKFSEPEWKVYRQILRRDRSLRTSSMGRLFDAAASLLGMGDRMTYEGEAAGKLEQLARGFFRRAGLGFTEAYEVMLRSSEKHRFDGKQLIAHLLEDLAKDVAPERLAARFHNTLVETARQMADRCGAAAICCSGGVFQNSLLVDLFKHRLGKNYRLYFHRQISPNDEGVSFGQLLMHLHAEGKLESEKQY